MNGKDGREHDSRDGGRAINNHRLPLLLPPPPFLLTDVGAFYTEGFVHKKKRREIRVDGIDL